MLIVRFLCFNQSSIFYAISISYLFYINKKTEVLNAICSCEDIKKDIKKKNTTNAMKKIIKEKNSLKGGIQCEVNRWLT